MTSYVKHVQREKQLFTERGYEISPLITSSRVHGCTELNNASLSSDREGGAPRLAQLLPFEKLEVELGLRVFQCLLSRDFSSLSSLAFLLLLLLPTTPVSLPRAISLHIISLPRRLPPPTLCMLLVNCVRHGLDCSP